MSKFLKTFGLFIGFAVLLIAFNNCGQSELPSSDLNKVNSTGSPTPTPNSGTPGSGSGSGPGSVTSNQFLEATGIYNGGLGTQVVFSNGEYWTFGGYGIVQMRFGQLSSVANGKFSGKITAGSFSNTSDMNGDYVKEKSFGNGTYSANSKTSPSISAITMGEYWGNSQDGDTPYLTFSSTGNISGYSANFQCTFSGKAEPHPLGLNIYKVTLTRSNCLNNGQSTTYYGLVLRLGNAIHVVGLNQNKDRAFTYEGYL